MALLNKIKNDSLTARKARALESGVLVTLLGEIDTQTKKFDPIRDMTDDEIVALVRKFIKNNDETQDAIANANNRDDDKHRLNKEKHALEAYLPPQMDKFEIAAVVEQQKALGLNMGQIMAYLKSNYAGRYNGALAAQVAKALLG